MSRLPQEDGAIEITLENSTPPLHSRAKAVQKPQFRAWILGHHASGAIGG